MKGSKCKGRIFPERFMLAFVNLLPGGSSPLEKFLIRSFLQIDVENLVYETAGHQNQETKRCFETSGINAFIDKKVKILP